MFCEEQPPKQPRRVSNGGCVSFAQSPMVHLLPDSPVASTMTDEERYLVWYSKSDIGSFKDQARVVGRCVRRQIRGAEDVTEKEGGNTSHRSLHTIRIEQEGCARGIENRVWPERQKKKSAALRVVLESQNRLRYLADSCFAHPSCNIDPTLHLCFVSRMATQWSRDVALEEGREDFVAAYPELHSLHVSMAMTNEIISKTSEIINTGSDLFDPIPISSFSPVDSRMEEGGSEKRTIFDSNSGRSVRQRISINDANI